MIISILGYIFGSLFLIAAWIMSLFFAEYENKKNVFKLFLFVPPFGMISFSYRFLNAAYRATFFDDEQD